MFAREVFVFHGMPIHLKAKCKCLLDFQAILGQFDTCIVDYYPFYTKYLFSLWQRNVCFENRFSKTGGSLRSFLKHTYVLEQTWVEILCESINNYGMVWSSLWH